MDTVTRYQRKQNEYQLSCLIELSITTHDFHFWDLLSYKTRNKHLFFTNRNTSILIMLYLQEKHLSFMKRNERRWQKSEYGCITENWVSIWIPRVNTMLIRHYIVIGECLFSTKNYFRSLASHNLTSQYSLVQREAKENRNPLIASTLLFVLLIITMGFKMEVNQIIYRVYLCPVLPNSSNTYLKTK